MTMSANRPSRRKMVGDPSSVVAFTTWPSSTTVLLPGKVLAGTGVEASASVHARSRFGSRTAISIGLRSSPRCEYPTDTPPNSVWMVS